ncbi:nudC domain-containing protein 3-like [Lineus longissimus]|uniref:nudC domain-containing protein 3-like n=1 Tax=Lineus longissimus TaxID=88925 RepID=UPI002B4D8806
MAGMDQKYDSALLGILQNEGQISNFLDTIFGFLYRRTDFYVLMKEKEGKMGFPPGVAANLAFSAYKKYETMAAKNEEDRQAREKRNAEVKFSGAGETPPVAKIVELPADADAAVESGSQDAAPEQKDTVMEVVPAAEDSAKEQAAEGSDTVKAKSVKNPEEEEEEDNDPEFTKKQKVYQANPESYNGAIRDNYSWSQMITDLDVRLSVPKNILKGKDVRVTIQRKHLKASYCDGTEWKDIIDEDLMWDINKEESMWTLVPGEHIHVNLEKIQERWWEALVVSEEKINVRKIDASRPMTDLDDEAQAKIHEMMYNEQQKRLGKPQSHEAKVHGMLQKAWDAEGSPFKGQKFDPSKFNVAPSGGT